MPESQKRQSGAGWCWSVSEN